MKQRIDAILDSTARLQEIRTRLAAIDEERAALEAEVAEILQRAGVGVRSAGTPDWQNERLRLPRRIISFLSEHPTQHFGTMAIAHAFGLSHKQQQHVLRQALARLANERRVVRIGRASYGYKPGAV